MKKSISVDYLRSRLSYDPETGKIYWKPRPAHSLNARRWNGRFAGKEAGSIHSLGYRILDLAYIKCAAHCVAWAIVHGHWPVNELDHINLDRMDNRIENLREASRSQNMQNRSAWSGFKGVTRKDNKWRARIQINNCTHYLGVFETPEEAFEAYCRAAEELHGQYARMR